MSQVPGINTSTKERIALGSVINRGTASALH